MYLPFKSKIADISMLAVTVFFNLYIIGSPVAGNANVNTITKERPCADDFIDLSVDTLRHIFTLKSGQKIAVDYWNGQFYLKGTNKLYTGEKMKFQDDILSYLNYLSRHNVSKETIDTLQYWSEVIVIEDSSTNLILWKETKPESHVIPMKFNRCILHPKNLIQGRKKDNAPCFVSLFHELSHIKHFKDIFGSIKGFYDNRDIIKWKRFFGVWYRYNNGRDTVAYTERYASCMENKLRASLPGIRLREFYSRSNREEGRLIHKDSKECIYKLEDL